MGALKVYAGVIAAITLILNIALLVVKKGWVPESIFHGKHAIDNIAMPVSYTHLCLEEW